MSWIPDEIYHRIEQADADTLLTWSERTLTAERVEDVITAGPRHPAGTVQPISGPRA